MFKSMVTGQAVQEHMEDVYHDMIKVCFVSRPVSSLHSLTDMHHAVHCKEHRRLRGGSIRQSRRGQGKAYVALHCLQHFCASSVWPNPGKLCCTSCHPISQSWAGCILRYKARWLANLLQSQSHDCSSGSRAKCHQPIATSHKREGSADLPAHHDQLHSCLTQTCVQGCKDNAVDGRPRIKNLEQ